MLILAVTRMIFVAFGGGLPQVLELGGRLPYGRSHSGGERSMTQRPQAVATVKITEPYVRVTEWRFADGAETGWHRHQYDYVVVPMMDGALRLEEPGGSSRTVSLAAHAPYTRKAGVEHNVVNASGHEFAFLEIELLE